MTTESDLRFTFSAGGDAFDVNEFRLSEGLSQTFRLDVELSGANPTCPANTACRPVTPTTTSSNASCARKASSTASSTAPRVTA